jgi:effector-binding domain-containing protein
VLIHAAMPVNADPGDDHDFPIADLPAIEQAATVLHRGSMDDVMATIQTLARWIDDHGYRSAGYTRKLYLDTPDDTSAWATEL